jgi:riboflavin kinase/FMN adenylyltransferase
MQIYRHIDDLNLSHRDSVVTLGNFDGIHLGHQALIRNAVQDARRRGLVSVVLTFEPHPLRVLAPARAPKMLLAHKDKMQIMQSLGVDCIVIQQFDLSFAAIPAEEFVQRVLLNRLKARKIWIGKDLRFGKGRAGDINTLKRWGVQSGFEVGIVEPIMVKDERVSSSRIRQFISDGRVDEVEPMLGRYHFVSGRVVAGHHRGRELGFPTANISTKTETIPQDGIYATLFHIGERRLLSVSSVGLNPTFDEGVRTIESFILDFEDQIYGEAVKLSFIKRIREERKFPSVEELSEQIRHDVSSAEAIFHDLKLSAQD